MVSRHLWRGNSTSQNIIDVARPVPLAPDDPADFPNQERPCSLHGNYGGEYADGTRMAVFPDPTDAAVFTLPGSPNETETYVMQENLSVLHLGSSVYLVDTCRGTSSCLLRWSRRQRQVSLWGHRLGMHAQPTAKMLREHLAVDIASRQVLNLSLTKPF